MAVMVKVTGVKEVVNNLRRTARRTASQTEGGLKRAGLFVQRESQQVVPIKFGILKNSAFTRNEGGHGFDADIVVGYTAHYAPYVHENLEARHAPGKEAKFLEKPIREKRDKILGIIAGDIKP